jgi:DNA-binding NtrC family response regulator
MGEHPRILVIDDDESIRKTLATILKEKGYLVDTAENGEEAIKKSEARFYNLALIDIRLPDMEGTKLLTAMRDSAPKMVKIIVTGYPSLQNAIEAVNKGADAYVLKPFNVDGVLGTIKEHLKKQQQAKRYDEGKVAEFIETRVRELEEEKTMANRKTR